ncbi:MAG: hypothetical protein LBT99_03950 [Bifidobacteriaceae bacterium]|jgi:hypothetical protein|nr:hypothetical protein [Bifidobacteriaceae bacterium]
MEIRKTNIENKKNNIEVRKNWNKFPFKKLGIIFCLFLFGVVAFVSGNLSQVNAASSSTVLPVAKGGTGSNSASGARTNLNAQETLVSGTNIKTAFGNSLLGSGNITNQSSGLSVSAGSHTTFQFGYAEPIKVINNGITLNLADRKISFKMGSYSTSYAVCTSFDNTPVTYSKYTENISSPIDVTFGSGWIGGCDATLNTTVGVYKISTKLGTEGFWVDAQRFW